MDKVKFEETIKDRLWELTQSIHCCSKDGDIEQEILDESVDMVIDIVNGDIIGQKGVMNPTRTITISDDDVRKLMDEYGGPDLSGHTGWDELECVWDSEKKKEYSGQTFKEYNYRTNRGVSNREYLSDQVHQFIIPNMLKELLENAKNT